MRYTTALLLATTAYSAVVQLNWNITYVTGVNPDKAFARRAVGVNGQWPPPAIVVDLGDTLIINANNQLDVGTSLHSHGLFQNGTTWMDGAAGVTQCHIGVGER